VPQSVPPLRIAGTEADRKPAAASVAPRQGFRIGPWLALAATIAICLGTGMVVLHYRQLQEQREIYAANDELLDAMIDVQQDNAAGKSIGASLPAPLSDPVALSSAAGRELGRKVPVVDFKPQGWKLESASFCEVHKLASVQFHFTRNGGKQHMTVLSMPASAWANAKDGSHYELTADGHPIAGFIRSGSLNCVVGDTALSSGDAVILRDAMRS
jgi:hypothetical protein